MIILQNESKKMKRLHLEKNDDPHLDASVQGVEAPLENACPQDETNNVGGQTTEIETVQEPLLNKDEAKKPKTFKEFIQKLPDDISPEKAQAEFAKYLNQFDKSREAIFFNEHKDEDWFKEKYDPVHVEKANKKRAEHARAEAKAFVEEFLSDKLKDVISADCKENDKSTILPSWHEDPKATNEDNGEKKETDPSDATENVDADANAADSTVPDVEGESSASQPISMKVISSASQPISMKKPGEVRPAAQEFRGPQSDNSFRDARNKGNHLRYCFDDQVFIQGIPLKTERSKLEEAFKDAKGFKELFLSDPVRSDRRIVNGWASFETQDDCHKVMNEEAQGGLNGKRISAAYYLTLFPKKKSRSRPHYVHQVFLHPERVTQDLNQCLALIKKYDEETNIHEHAIFSPETLDPLPSDLHRLNLCLEYLRRVHLCAYYQTRRFKHAEHMRHKLPQAVVRNRGDYSRGTKQDPFPVENEVDESFKFELENQSGKIHEDSWENRKREKLATENTKEVKQGSKYRCALCRKAFKGHSYVEKHILLKHEPIVVMYLGKQREKEILHNYSSDRSKITAQHFQQDEHHHHNNRGGRGRFNNRGGGRRDRYRRHNNFGGRNFGPRNFGPRKMDAPPPFKFDHNAPQVLKTADTVRTVKSYEDVGDDIGIDDLLDFGFGDFEKAPKFNL